MGACFTLNHFTVAAADFIQKVEDSEEIDLLCCSMSDVIRCAESNKNMIHCCNLLYIDLRTVLTHRDEVRWSWKD
jgi:hypothetical protein